MSIKLMTWDIPIAIDNHGTPYPEETSMKAGKADCILLGAVGTKKT